MTPRQPGIHRCPTTQPRLLGTPIPADPEFRVSDSVTVSANEAVFTAEKAFAAVGQIGLDLVQFRLDSSTPSGTDVLLTVAVNGVKSNSLMIPVK